MCIYIIVYTISLVHCKYNPNIQHFFFLRINFISFNKKQAAIILSLFASAVHFLYSQFKFFFFFTYLAFSYFYTSIYISSHTLETHSLNSLLFNNIFTYDTTFTFRLPYFVFVNIYIMDKFSFDGEIKDKIIESKTYHIWYTV